MTKVKKMQGWKILKTVRKGDGSSVPTVVKKWRIRAQSNLRQYDQDRLIKGRPSLFNELMKSAAERTEIPGGKTPFTEFTKQKFEKSQRVGAQPITGAQEAIAKGQQMRQAAEARAPQIKPITGLRKAAGKEETMAFEGSFLKGFAEEIEKAAMCGNPHEGKVKTTGTAYESKMPKLAKKAGLFTLLKEGVSISAKIQAAKADPSTKANPKDTGPQGSGLQDPRVKAQQAKMKTGLFGK